MHVKEREGGGYSFVAYLSRLTIDHAFTSRRSTAPTTIRDSSNIFALITRSPLFTKKFFAYCKGDITVTGAA